MEAQEFAAGLAREGFVEIETKTMAARPANEDHGHDCIVRGMVLDGEFIVACNGKPRAYHKGEIFEVPANTPHTEEIGPGGTTIVVGRKY